jgi:hypothetical protein
VSTKEIAVENSRQVNDSTGHAVPYEWWIGVSTVGCSCGAALSKDVLLRRSISTTILTGNLRHKRKKENRHAHWNHRSTGSLLLMVFGICCHVAASSISGSFALQGGEPSTQARLEMTTAGKEHLTMHLDFAMTRIATGLAVRDYQVELTKKLHVIIVSENLSVFLHVHPRLLQNGHFVLDQHFPAEGKYHIFADATPAGLEQQVFRFDVGIGAVSAGHTGALVPTGTLVTAGPYTVTLSTATLTVGRPEMIQIHIAKHGVPARDLHPYLGVAAHAVLVQSTGQSYVHAHSMSGDSVGHMDMGVGQSKSLADSDTALIGSDSMLHLTLREPGEYKLWLQFRGGEALYVAPFIVIGRE